MELITTIKILMDAIRMGIIEMLFYLLCKLIFFVETKENKNLVYIIDNLLFDK